MSERMRVIKEAVARIAWHAQADNIKLARECGASEERIAELCLPRTYIASGYHGMVGPAQLAGVDPNAELLAAGQPTIWIRCENGRVACLGAEAAFTAGVVQRQGVTEERARQIVDALVAKGVLVREDAR